MSDKAVTQMTDPEYTVEFDGKETYVMRNGVKLAIPKSLAKANLHILQIFIPNPDSLRASKT